jgi:hypothetical protein
VQAAQEAADAEGSVAGTHHLLLGLLQVGLAANVLDRLGVTRERVAEASARLLRAGGGTRTVGDGEAYDNVMRARRLATSRGQHLTRTQHLLWIVATDPGSSARRILEDLGVEASRLKKELDDFIPPPPKPGRRPRKIGRRAGVPSCSFCGCTDPHRAMVHGPGVQICGECVVLAGEIIAAGQSEGGSGPGRRLIG